jgi:outer membrane lipoprotein-sorting protein
MRLSYAFYAVSELGDLLELLYGAHRSFHSVRGRLIEVPDSDVSRHAFDAMAERQEEDGSSTFVQYAWDVSEEEEPLPSRHETEIDFWFERPRRIREEYRSAHPHGRDGFVGVRDGEHWRFFDPRIGARANERNTDAGIGDSFQSLLDPVDVLAGFDLELRGEVEQLGRPGIDFTARPRAVPNKMLEHFHDLVDELRCIADRERGILLRRASIFGGEEMDVREIVQIDFDEDFPPGTFELQLPEGEEFGSDDDFRFHDVTPRMRPRERRSRCSRFRACRRGAGV